ncbi:MAG: hypothetical protein KGJ43_08615, partial [Acidobacteriota bacterium]|nr:hypothetical protein [Acidobacteriota bacterium]
GVMLDDVSAARASQALFASAPIYEGLTLDEIGGRGVRWQERAAAASCPAPPGPEGLAVGGPAARGTSASGEGALRPGRPLSLWDAPEVEHSPALRFLFRKHVLREGPAGDAGGEGIASEGGGEGGDGERRDAVSAEATVGGRS